MNIAIMLAALAAVSPNGRNEIRLDCGSGGLEYSVFRDGKAIVSPSGIALEVKGHPFAASIESSEPFTLDGTLATPLYKKSEISLAANGIRVKLRGGYSVELVARDDGVAYRFATAFPGEKAYVMSERADVNFPSADISLWAGYPTIFKEKGEAPHQFKKRHLAK
jgi:alpha-glucosidase